MSPRQNDGIDVSFSFLSVMKRFVPFPIFIDPEKNIFFFRKCIRAFNDVIRKLFLIWTFLLIEKKYVVA